MKRNSKKIISLFLVFVLLFSMTYSAFAAAEETVSGISVTLSSNKKQYKSGEEIKIKTKVQNDTEDKQYVSIVYSATPLIKSAGMGKYSIKYAGVSGGETAEYEAMGTARRSVFSAEWIQSIYDAVFGSLWSAIYMIKAMFSSSYEAVSVKVDGVSAVVLAQVTSSETLPGAKKVSLKYNLSGVDVDNYPSEQSILQGEIPIEPEFPEHSDYVFNGWYTSESFEDPFYFESYLEEDTTIYAKWTKKLSSKEALEKKSYNPYYDLKTNESSFSFDNEVPGKGLRKASVSYVLKNGSGIVSVHESNDSRTFAVGMIGKPIDIQLFGDELESAVITFSYNKSSLPDGVEEDELGILYYNEKKQYFELLENVVVDKENCTVSVPTTHFSKYVLIDTSAWHTAWEHKQLVSRDTGKSLRFNIVLCLDSSGSMSGTPSTVCQSSAQAFVDELVDGDRVAVVSFNSYATTLVAPTTVSDTNKETIKNKIRLSASGGTSFNSALDRAISLLSTMPDHTTDYEILKNYIVFISDGQSSAGDEQIAQLVKYGYNVMAIGVGGNVSENVLKNLAEQSGGSYAYVSDPNNIASIFQQVQGEYIGLSQDSDGDNIADLVEKTGMITQSGYIYQTDPLNPDTDGDGISDSEEMGAYDDSLGCFIMRSSPTTPTFRSDEAKVVLRLVAPENRLLDTRSTSYMSKGIYIAIDTEYMYTARDLLSETFYSDAKDVVITFKSTQGLNRSTNIGSIKAGESFEKTYYISVDDIFNSEGTLTVTISGSNFEPVEKSLYYNFYQDYCNALSVILQSQEESLRHNGTKAIHAYSDLVNESKKEVEKAIILQESTIAYGQATAPKELVDQLQKALSKQYIDKAKELATSKKLFASYDAEQVVKDVANQFSTETSELTFKIGSIEYKAQIHKTGYMAVGFGTVEVTASNGKKYSFVYSNTQEQIYDSINAYMDYCKDLENKALDECVNAAISDSAKILELDTIKTFIDAKCGKFIDWYLEKAGLGFKYENLKSYYKLYKKAKDAFDSLQGLKEPSEKKIEKYVKSINDLINFDITA